MAKKRAKSKVSQATESTEVLEPTCTHIRKGLEQGNLKKALPEREWNICQDCQPDNKAKENLEEEMVEIPSVWLCLKCGHRGCDRNSQEKHALQHYNTPRSDCHCLVLNLDNWSVWCYLCDDEVPYSSSNRLGQLVDFVRKETNKQSRVLASQIILKEQEKKELENKKLEKDSKNEKEKVKHVAECIEEKAIPSVDTNVEVTVKGLSNLGNTCFFNAVMQNLSQTPVLRELLKEVKMTGTTITVEALDSSLNEPLLINLEQLPGSLTSSMCQFITEIQETKKGTVTPKELFSQVCKKAIRFKGYQQQDSQELLRYLLDGMRAEEIQRVKIGIIKSMNDSAQKSEDEEEIKRKANEFEKKKMIPNFVDRIFGGELSSTILCDECRTVSLVHESFLDLSLPVLDEQAVKKGPYQKNARLIPEKESEEEEDNESCVKENIDSSPGASKYLQKKAKKQAKKQAKNQRRQHKVLQLSDLATAEEQSEVNQNGYVETSSLEESLLEKNNQKQEVEGLLQNVEHSLVLNNDNEENDTNVLSAHEHGKSQVLHGVETVIKMEDTLEMLHASEDANKLDSHLLKKGSLCLEKANYCWERDSPCLKNGDQCLEESRLCLNDDKPMLEEDRPCLVNGSPCLENGSSCFEESIPCVKEGNTRVEKGSPCLEKGSPCLEKGSPCLEKGSPCLEKGSPCSDNGSPCSDKASPCMENGSPCIENDNPCMENGSPCMENGSPCMENGSPCLENGSPCLENGSPCLEESIPCVKLGNTSVEEGSSSSEKGSPCSEKGSPCSEKGSPYLEKGSPYLERESEEIDDLASGFDQLHLRSVVEPHDIHIDILESCNTSETKLYEVVNEDPETAFCTLADRDAINTDECSVESCLYQFTRNEKLSENNKLLCNVCTGRRYSRLNSNIKGEKKHVYTNAKKQMLISLAPPILTLHLKRFQQAGINLRKVNRHIKFPELIDLAPFCTVKCKNVAAGDTRVLYSLYGVVEHSGTMRSGHYTAFVKVRRPNTRLSDLVIHRVIPQALETESLKGQWYHISDSHVQDVPLTRVLNSQAYLLFYERLL